MGKDISFFANHKKTTLFFITLCKKFLPLCKFNTQMTSTHPFTGKETNRAGTRRVSALALARGEGLEPPTLGFGDRYSTN